MDGRPPARAGLGRRWTVEAVDETLDGEVHEQWSLHAERGD